MQNNSALCPWCVPVCIHYCTQTVQGTYNNHSHDRFEQWYQFATFAQWNLFMLPYQLKKPRTWHWDEEIDTNTQSYAMLKWSAAVYHPRGALKWQTQKFFFENRHCRLCSSNHRRLNKTRAPLFMTCNWMGSLIS